jgi:hypothetical protein
LTAPGEIRYITADLPSDLTYIDLHCVSDIHRGNHLFNEKAWYAMLERVSADAHARLVINGDGTEMALKSSKYGETYATMRPKEERQVLTKELSLVRDRILMITSGNHDARPEKDSDENPMERIASDLDLAKVYEPIGGVLQVAFGKRHGEASRKTVYQFYVTHGAGGGRRPGGKINRMQEMAWVVEGVDGYIQGHAHSLMSYIEERFIADPRNRMCRPRPVAYVISGSFVKYGGYAQVGSFTPNANAMPILRLGQEGSHDECKPMEVILPTRIRPIA